MPVLKRNPTIRRPDLDIPASGLPPALPLWMFWATYNVVLMSVFVPCSYCLLCALFRWRNPNTTFSSTLLGTINSLPHLQLITAWDERLPAKKALPLSFLNSGFYMLLSAFCGAKVITLNSTDGLLEVFTAVLALPHRNPARN